MNDTHSTVSPQIDQPETRPQHLAELLDRASRNHADQAAVEDEQGRALSYRELAHAADRLATRLARWGVGPEDRVGLFVPKSLESVAAIHGILRSGAAYVPVDPTAPVLRGAGILADAQVRTVVIAGELADSFRAQWPGPGPLPRLILIGSDNQCQAGDATWPEIQKDLSPSPLPPKRQGDDLAYILYTSGSTGRPKGVMLSHANAFNFLDWCARTFSTRLGDRFSSHAPFHFDLSVFDLYASCMAGGTLVLVGESLSKDPVALGAFLASRQIDVWYSAPSILALLTQYGSLEAGGFTPPRIVLFAGEVFPIRHLKRLRNLWPEAQLWNLYGPTETNVCTAHAIPDVVPEDRDKPYPIGTVCLPYEARVVDEQGQDVPVGAEGELWIAGPGAMRGYFGRPDLDAGAFVATTDGKTWYRTGDLVTDDGTGCFTYHGRRDRMVKKRGYRIELGEIESALYRHDEVDRAAVIARCDDSGVAISAFVSMKEGRKGSIIAMKRHCTTYLPNYMVPDSIAFLAGLPMTSTDKIDYQNLERLARERNEPPKTS